MGRRCQGATVARARPLELVEDLGRQRRRADHARQRPEAENPALSAQSLVTRSVSTSPPSSRSRISCDGCQIRSLTYRAMRGSNAISIVSGVPWCTPSECAKASSDRSCGSKRSSVTETCRMRSIEKVRSAVLGHERDEIQSALREDQTLRFDGVFLLAAARERVVAHDDAAMVQRGVEQLRRRAGLAGGSAAAVAGGAGVRDPGSAFAWITSGSRSRNWRMPGVSAAASRSNALRTSCWNGVAARHSTSVRLK